MNVRLPFIKRNEKRVRRLKRKNPSRGNELKTLAGAGGADTPGCTAGGVGKARKCSPGKRALPCCFSCCNKITDKTNFRRKWLALAPSLRRYGATMVRETAGHIVTSQEAKSKECQCWASLFHSVQDSSLWVGTTHVYAKWSPTLINLIWKVSQTSP